MNDQSKSERKYWPQFDAYVKQVIKAAKCSLIRQEVRSKKVITFEDTIIVTCMDHGCEADYPSNHHQMYVDGERIPIDDERLYRALQKLPDNLLRVLILKFWRCNSEKEIADQFQISVRSCYTRRKKALEYLKLYMEESNGGRAEQ